MPSRPASWMYGFGRLITECPAGSHRRSRALSVVLVKIVQLFYNRMNNSLFDPGGQMNATPSQLTRRRGGQPGNRNALRHGFYARSLAGLAPLQGPPEGTAGNPNSVINEIAMLRLAVRETAARASGSQPPQVELELLRAVSIAAAALNRLIKTQTLLNADQQPPLTEPVAGQPIEGEPAPMLSAEDLAAAREPNVDEEIELLRNLIQRVTRRQTEWETLEESAAVVRGLAIANITLTHLLRTRKLLTDARDPQDDFQTRLRAIQRQLRRVEHWED